ncbi:hypothetical protein BT69DRAFT_1337922 [Atractiella rhizophila]|nr:hypothetical protein BT69DRAFT_1337922 [Atractiella rhizophila]
MENERKEDKVPDNIFSMDGNFVQRHQANSTINAIPLRHPPSFIPQEAIDDARETNETAASRYNSDDKLKVDQEGGGGMLEQKGVVHNNKTETELYGVGTEVNVTDMGMEDRKVNGGRLVEALPKERDSTVKEKME